MNIQRLSCCNWGEIANLGYAEKNGKRLMQNFVGSLYKLNTRFDYKTNTNINELKSTLTDLYTVYIFSGVVNRGWQQFNGEVFARFIQENRLGEVVTITPAMNLGYHPESQVQAWMWVPDQKALNAWAKVHATDAMKSPGIPANNYWGGTGRPFIHGCAVCDTCLEGKGAADK